MAHANVAAGTIDSALEQFLTAERERLAPRTFAEYEDVVSLLRSCLNNYGHTSLDARERRRFEAACEAGDEEAFCHLFGPAKIVENYGEFLGYFMVRKVAAGAEFQRRAGTVTKRLAKWLAEEGHIDPQRAGDAEARASDAGRDLPAASKLGDLLADLAAKSPDIDIESLANGDYVEDSLEITRVEAGKLWFEGVGPVAVPRAASELARPGWSVWVVLARHRDRWWLLEHGFVYP